MQDPPFDLAIVGAGIVGAAIAHFMAPAARVLVLEAEPAAGTQATGRSAALFEPAYGPPQVRALTRASRGFFEHPPGGFGTVPLLRPRPGLFVGTAADEAGLRALHARLNAEGLPAQLLAGEDARRLVPVLRPEACTLALLDPSSSDIDVDALLQGYLRSARRAGAQVCLQARLQRAVREGGHWLLETAAGHAFRARTLVNAAGAWADPVAAGAGVTPIALQPRRRSAFLFEAPAGLDTAGWPAVVAADESWYFKPDAGLLLGSPANADPVEPHDVVAEELDIATGIARIEAATTMTIRRPRATWAGLRSFVADGEPVLGFDPQVPGFFWAAALGGYGIQSSPGMGALCASLLQGAPLPAALAAEGVEPALLRAGRPGARGHPAPREAR